MSIGSDFTSGYGQGLNTRQANQGPSFNPWGYLEGNARNVSAEKIALINASGRGGGGSSPKQILYNASMDALREKEMQLNNASKELDIKAKEIDIANTQRRASDERIKTAEDRAKGIATDRASYETDQKKAQSDAAVRGFYTRDEEAIKNFINSNGNRDANVVAVDWGPDDDPETKGTVSMKFSDGNIVAFANPQDAIEKVVVPMLAIQQDIKGRMSEADKVKAEQEDKKIGISERRVAAYEKGAENRGVMTDKQNADLRMKAQGQAFNEYKDGDLDFEEIDARAEEIYRNSLPETSQGVPTETNDNSDGVSSGMAALPDPSQHKDRTVRDTSTGERYKSDGKNWKKVGSSDKKEKSDNDSEDGDSKKSDGAK